MIILIMAPWQFYTILPFYFSTTILLAHCGQVAPSLTCMTLFIQSHNCYFHSRKKKLSEMSCGSEGAKMFFSAMKWKYIFNMSMESKQFLCSNTLSACKYGSGRDWCVRLYCWLLWLYWFHSRLAQVTWTQTMTTTSSSVSTH